VTHAHPEGIAGAVAVAAAGRGPQVVPSVRALADAAIAASQA
jgi:ADP-ribosylglycohydrolase